MKGVCNIKVVNEDGTIAQDVTDENMVTDYLEKLINPNYFILKEIFGSREMMAFDVSFYPLIDKVIGGVFLFGENVPENEKCEFPTYSLVGHASSVHPYSLSTCGMFNINESEEIKDAEGNFKGYKFVWDFATDRANGTIKCVSLTTGHAGQKGYAKSIDSKVSNSFYFSSLYKSGAYPNTRHVPNIFETRTGNYLLSRDDTHASSYGVYIDYFSKDCRLGSLKDNTNVMIGNLEKDVFIYVTAMTKRSITLANFKVGHTQSLSDDYYYLTPRSKKSFEKTINFDRDVFPDITSSISVDCKDIIGKVYTDNQYIYITGVETHGCYVYVVDSKTFEIIDTKVANDENITFNISSDYYGDKNFSGCAYYKGNFYASIFYDAKDGTTYPYRLGLAKMNASNLRDYEIIQDMTTGKFKSLGDIRNIENGTSYSVVNDVLFIAMCSPSKSSDANSVESISIKDDKIIMHGSGFIPINTVDLEFPYCVVKRIENYGSNYFRNYAYFGYGICTHGLITIDNLSTPIIKNSTQTMKITYEITEVDETA